jgi:hypothetical protein
MVSLFSGYRRFRQSPVVCMEGFYLWFY